MELLEPIHARAAALARRLCRSSADGDDLFQEAVLRALDKLPALQEPSRFPGWFYRILISVHRNRSRSAFWRRFLPLPQAGDRAAAEPVGEDGGLWEERRLRARRLSEALSRIPAEQREAIVLFELEGFTVEEIAGLQRSSVPAVKSRLSRGREKLRGHYRRLGMGVDMEPGLKLEGEQS